VALPLAKLIGAFSSNDGRFDLNSDLHVQDFLNNCFDVKVLKDLTINGDSTDFKNQWFLLL
jgi:hypothetical protein